MSEVITRTPALPPLPSGLPPDMARLLTVMRENLQVLLGQTGDPLDAAARFRDMSAMGLVTLGTAGSLGGGKPSDLTPVVNPPTPDQLARPPVPVGLTALSGFDVVILGWESPNFAWLDFTEVWRSPTPNLAEAALLMTAPGTLAVDKLGGDKGTKYYWIRHVSRFRKDGAPNGPYSPESVSGKGSDDPGFMLDLLTGQIRESHLYQSLNERINLIDTPDAGLVDRLAQEVFDRGQGDEVLRQDLAAEVTARANEVAAVRTDLSAEVFARTGGDVALGARITTEEQTRADGDTALATSITALTARVDNNQAAIVTEQTARATQDDALAQQYTGLAARVTSTENGIATTSAAITAEVVARANADSAIATNVTDLQARITTAEGGIAVNVAAIHSEQQARADGDSALASSMTALAARVDANQAAIVVEQQTRADQDGALATQYTGLAARVTTTENGVSTNAAAIQAEQMARANADSAIASSVTTLQARVETTEGGIAANSAAIQTEQQVRADGDSALASSLNTLATRVGAAESSIVTEQQARADADGAQAAQYTGLAARMTTAEGGIASNVAAITAEQTARVNADSAIATDVTNLAARVTTTQQGVTINAAALQTEQTARANADSALSNSIQTLSAQTATEHGTAMAAIQAEQTARTNADTTITTNVTTLQSRLDNVGGQVGASLEQKMTTQASVNDGLLAQYTLKAQIDQDGRTYVAGIALAAEAVAGNPASSLILLQADKVAIGAPGMSGRMPFIVKDGNVYINAAFIENATITNAMIQTVVADKITGGTIQAGNDIIVGGAIKGGKASYSDTSPGFWQGYDQSAYKFVIGNATNYIRWTGSRLELKGDVISSEDATFDNMFAASLDATRMTSQSLGCKAYYMPSAAAPANAADPNFVNYLAWLGVLRRTIRSSAGTGTSVNTTTPVNTGIAAYNVSDPNQHCRFIGPTIGFDVLLSLSSGTGSFLLENRFYESFTLEILDQNNVALLRLSLYRQELGVNGDGLIVDGWYDANVLVSPGGTVPCLVSTNFATTTSTTKYADYSSDSPEWNFGTTLSKRRILISIPTDSGKLTYSPTRQLKARVVHELVNFDGPKRWYHSSGFVDFQLVARNWSDPAAEDQLTA